MDPADGLAPLPDGARAPLWLLTMLAFSGTVGMYIFLPALPLVAQGLGASTATVQLAVSLYIVGLALGQLVYGPLSDRLGRRPVLIVGLALFTAAGLASAWHRRAAARHSNARSAP